MTLAQLTTQYYATTLPTEQPGWRVSTQLQAPALSLEARLPFLVDSRGELNSQPRYPRSRVSRCYYYKPQSTSNPVSRAVLAPSNHHLLLDPPGSASNWIRPRRPLLLDKSGSHHTHPSKAPPLLITRKPQPSPLRHSQPPQFRVPTAVLETRKCRFSKSCPVISSREPYENEVVQERRLFAPIHLPRCLPEALFQAPPPTHFRKPAASHILAKAQTPQISQALQCTESSNTSSPEPFDEEFKPVSPQPHFYRSLSPLATPPTETRSPSCKPNSDADVNLSKEEDKIIENLGLSLRPATTLPREYESEFEAAPTRLELGISSASSTRPNPAPPILLGSVAGTNSATTLGLPTTKIHDAPLHPKPDTTSAPFSPEIQPDPVTLVPAIQPNSVSFSSAQQRNPAHLAPAMQKNPVSTPLTKTVKSKLSLQFSTMTMVGRNHPTKNSSKTIGNRSRRRRSISFQPSRRTPKSKLLVKVGRRQSLQFTAPVSSELPPLPSESSQHSNGAESSESPSVQIYPHTTVLTAIAKPETTKLRESTQPMRTLDRKRSLISPQDPPSQLLLAEPSASLLSKQPRDYSAPVSNLAGGSQISNKDLYPPPSFPTRQRYATTVPKALGILAGNIASSVFKVATQFSKVLTVSLPTGTPAVLPIVDELVQELFLRRRKGRKIPNEEVRECLDQLQSCAYTYEAFTVPIESRWPRPHSHETQLPEAIEVDINNLEAAFRRQRFRQLVALFPDHDRLQQRDSLVQTHCSPRSQTFRPQGPLQDVRLRARPVHTATNLKLSYYRTKQKAMHRTHSEPMVRPRREERYEERIYGRLKGDPSEVLLC